MTHIDQNKLILLGIPPSRADIKITEPLLSVQNVHSDLFQMGLTASDLKPIDWRKKVDLSPVQDQVNCGNCWAMASTSALADRFIIQKSIQKLVLDPLIVAQCVPITKNKGCNGGSPFAAGKYFEEKGAYDSDYALNWSDICTKKNYCSVLGHNLELPSCNQIEQTIKKQAPIYKALPGSTRITSVVGKQPNTIDDQATIVKLKHELLHGPFVVSYLVPADFMASIEYRWDKTNGIYINGAYNDILDEISSPALKKHFHIVEKDSKIIGNKWDDILIENGKPFAHAVEVVGWDVDNAGPYGKVPYWIVKNSWGPFWLEDGYFRIAMNDYATTGKHFNAKLALDVPIFYKGKYFGGGTAFDPDTKSGAPHGYVYSDPTHGVLHGRVYPSSKKKRNIKWLIIVAVLLIIILAAYLISKYFFGKEKQEKARKSK